MCNFSRNQFPAVLVLCGPELAIPLSESLAHSARLNGHPATAELAYGNLIAIAIEIEHQIA